MYLLDVNVLLGFWYCDHTAHQRVAEWIRDVEFLNPGVDLFKTCAIIELGFIRVASGSAGFAETVEGARADLLEAKATLKATLLNDDVAGDRQPYWVLKSGQTTDGHLLELARRYKMRLATLDRGIPGAVLIPAYTDGVREAVPEEGRFVSFENYTGEPGTIPREPDPRWTIDLKTGFPCVRATPGVKKITTEDVKRWLEDFP
jgi:predicted nucleic acid-binding protein